MFVIGAIFLAALRVGMFEKNGPSTIPTFLVKMRLIVDYPNGLLQIRFISAYS